jgi:hypothetical protein|tara:strand:+ start:44 stop:229 length:186 start_codon:yes stop_codon:yes gene_type:complete
MTTNRKIQDEEKYQEGFDKGYAAALSQCKMAFKHSRECREACRIITKERDELLIKLGLEEK